MGTDPEPAPILVLGLGNLLLGDDGAGLELLDRLRQRFDDPRVEFLDGGTQGIALGGHLPGRRALLILDAVALGAAAGTVHVVESPQDQVLPRGFGAHGANASELLATAALLGELPEEIVIVGIEAADLDTGIGLSEPVREALPQALGRAEEILTSQLGQLERLIERSGSFR